MMATLEAAKPLTDDELPPRSPRGAPLGKEGALVADLLKLLLKIRSREIDVAARLLARSEDLELLAAGVRDLVVVETDDALLVVPRERCQDVRAVVEALKAKRPEHL